MTMTILFNLKNKGMIKYYLSFLNIVKLKGNRLTIQIYKIFSNYER